MRAPITLTIFTKVFATHRKFNAKSTTGQNPLNNPRKQSTTKAETKPNQTKPNRKTKTKTKRNDTKKESHLEWSAGRGCCCCCCRAERERRQGTRERGTGGRLRWPTKKQDKQFCTKTNSNKKRTMNRRKIHFSNSNHSY